MEDETDIKMKVVKILWIVLNVVLLIYGIILGIWTYHFRKKEINSYVIF